MIRKRDVHDCYTLFDLMTHPEVFPFVRHKASSMEEMMFMTKQIIEVEEKGECITRTIIDDFHQPIGVIGLYDIMESSGFLATWIGKPYHGQGYNGLAKDLFMDELFFEQKIERVFVKIRKRNLRSLKAMGKLPYSIFADDLYPNICVKVNQGIEDEQQFHLFVIEKEAYLFYRHAQQLVKEESMEA